MMSTSKSVLGIPLLALSVLLIVVVVGFAVPAETQPHALDIAPTAMSAGSALMEVVPPMNASAPRIDTSRSVTTLKLQSSSPVKAPAPVLLLSGAERSAGLLLPAILVLVAVLSCAYVAATRNVYESVKGNVKSLRLIGRQVWPETR
jgi:hypothetical protein